MELKRIRNAAVILSGVDLRTATESELKQVTNVVAEEGIVILKHQKMPIERFNEINLSWGTMHKSAHPACHPDYPYIFRVTNQTLEKGQKGMFSQGFLDWHCNSVVCPDPEEVVCLYGEQPLGRTPTTYSNVTKMYDDLPENMKDELKNLVLLFPRQALHSYKIEFYHPIKQKHIKITCELPYDMKDLNKNLQ